MEIDSGARAMLERVAVSEAELMKQFQKNQATTTRGLIDMFSGSRNVQVYKNKTGQAGFQRTG